MVELTEAVRAELRRWLAGETKSDQVIVRLVYSDSDGWKLSRDTRGPKDVALTTASDLPTLVCSPELAVQLEGAILHFRGLADNNYGEAGLALLRPRVGIVRAQWSPGRPEQPRPDAISVRILNWLFRRGIPSGSTTQNASP